MKLTLDRSRCTGIGMCEAVDPDRFEIDESGELIVHSEEVAPQARAAVEEAVLACPTAALQLRDD